ncbi:MarR family winged helix-turn-helix transcriptional regulator [Roseibium sp. Sym1]|uniref:MarR family winged helix-turn-helix transcriptional regulator n=1 Tax=Roseibium sp. Sym1 TaxID=3016006 RepID=UPI0022B54693|nr:MarR family transcriptional regulator [Roseibium sp. Sym1]
MSDPKGTKPARNGPSPGRKPVLVLSGFLPYRLNQLAETVSRSFSKIYADKYGIGIPEWRVLAMLGEREVMTARDVSQATSMHKTKVSRAVATLEKRNFILRDTNPLDQREQTLKLSAEGIAVYEDIVPRALAYTQELEDALTEEQKALLDDLFDRLHRAAGAPGHN